MLISRIISNRKWVDSQNKMRFFLIWLRVKKNNLINSKAFIFLLGIIIGASFLYTYIEGVKLVDYIRTGYAYANSTPYVSEASAADPVGEKVFDKENGVVVSDSTPQSIIAKYDWDVGVATAVFKTESGMNERAMNWNCRYNGVSKQCRPEDREKAWSVDCGIAQINVIGKTCPEEMFNPEKNLAKAYEMWRKRGFQPWVTYVNNYHLGNL